MNEFGRVAERPRIELIHAATPQAKGRVERADQTLQDRLYLGIEYAFVDSAAAALGYAAAKAPSFLERSRLALGLYGLVTDQEQFFVSAFDRIGEWPLPPAGAGRDPLAAPLHDLLRRYRPRLRGNPRVLARGKVDVSDRVLESREEALLAPDDPGLGLAPCRGPFVEQVEWMPREIDLPSRRLEPERQCRPSSIFELALDAEMSFHDLAYSRP